MSLFVTQAGNKKGLFEQAFNISRFSSADAVRKLIEENPSYPSG